MLLNEEKLILNFSLFNNWEEKYEYLIDLGEDICFIAPEKKTPEYLIKGCQSKVWLDFEFKDNKLYFYGDSDALLTLYISSALSLSPFFFISSIVTPLINIGNHIPSSALRGLKFRMITKETIRGVNTIFFIFFGF